jgi:hypothetical protein
VEPLAALPLADLFAMWAMLPAFVYPAATLARRGDLARAHATLPVDDGRWIRIEAAPLDGDRDGDIAVTIRAAAPSEAGRHLTDPAAGAASAPQPGTGIRAPMNSAPKRPTGACLFKSIPTTSSTRCGETSTASTTGSRTPTFKVAAGSSPGSSSSAAEA